MYNLFKTRTNVVVVCTFIDLLNLLKLIFIYKKKKLRSYEMYTVENDSTIFQ